MAAEPLASLVVTDLTVGGMTCAACVRRVEKRLGKLEGVTATVNLATGLARVSHPAGVAPEELVSAVEQAGYRAALPVIEEEQEAGDLDGTGSGEGSAAGHPVAGGAGAGAVDGVGPAVP